MGETIKLTASDGHELSAYRADPAGDAKAGLVVIQEIFGVNDHIREVCDGFAADGYAAVAPALFDRAQRGVELAYKPETMAEGRAIRENVSWEATVLDASAAAGVLGGAGKVGVVGYCWGGSVTWLTACRADGFAAAVGYYGGQIVQFKDEEPRCPIMLHFGEIDAAIPLDDVEAIRLAKPDVPVYVYDGADHGFNCDHRATYHAEASATARERTLAFLADHLG